MPWISNLIAWIFNYWHSIPAIKTKLVKTSNPLRMGVLGAAAISPIALFDPIDTHPAVLLVGIAARDVKRAEEQIRRWNRGPECKAYLSYDELLNDPSIDAVYIPTPNGLHLKWAVKALGKGKHVLLEKPATSNASQVAKLKNAVAMSGKVCLEAYHYRFHPAVQRVRELVASGEYGDILEVQTSMRVPRGLLPLDDIRFNYGLAGGASMDLCYVYSVAILFALATPYSEFVVREATPRMCSKYTHVDEALLATTEIRTSGRSPVVVRTDCDLSTPLLWGLIPSLSTPSASIDLQHATVSIDNFFPHSGHKITVRSKTTGAQRDEKLYTGGSRWGEQGEEWYTTYRWQMEAFVDKLRGRAPKVWAGLDETEMTMRFIDAIYDKAGLP